MQKQIEDNDLDYKKVSLDDKRKHEKDIVNLMIKIYCKGNKHNSKGLCDDCFDLIVYSNTRLDKCPFMKTKTFCKNCNVHCFKEDKKVKIKNVMKYSGPRMLFYHPIIAIKHGIKSYKDKLSFL